jgi:hypothetical protein
MQTGSLTNLIHARSTNGQPDPVVGMGATELHWTDRSPVTIIEVSKSGKSIKVQADNAKRVDDNGMSECQDYEYSTNPDGAIHTYTLRSNGRWVRKGEPMKQGGALRIGIREMYHDYGF